MLVQPAYPIAARLRAWLYLVALLAVAAFAHTENNATPLVVGLIVAVIAWVVQSSPRPRPAEAALPAPATGVRAAGAPESLWRRLLPRLAVNAVVLAAAFYFWYEARLLAEPGNRSNMVVALAHFMEVLLLCKFFESNSLRDGAQILVLSLLLVVSATMFSSSGLAFFLILAVCLGCLFYVVMLLNLFGETRPGSAGPVAVVAGQGTPGLGGRAAPLGLFRRDLRDATRQCLFLVLPVALALFLVLPRHRSNPFFSWGFGSYQTGFSETVELRDFGRLEPSDDEVMRVTLRRGDEDVSGEFSDLYFRGQVLDQYNERGVWSHGPPTFRGGVSSEPASTGEDLQPPSSSIQVTYEPRKRFPINGRLLILAPCIPPGDERFDYSRDDMTCRVVPSGARADGQLKYTLVWAKDLSPQVEGDAYCEPGVLTGGTLFAAGGSVRNVTVTVSPQIRELAQDLVKHIVTPGKPIDPGQIRSVVTIFENYLRSNYAYSMTFRRVDTSLERTTDFLLNRKTSGGNCEYFASAEVMMCRAVGLNARMVSGYHSNEYYAPGLASGYFLVRQKHAHTWAEYYLPGQGWILTDPTPGGAGTDGAGLSGNWFRDFVRVVQGNWLASVISFDNDSRAEVAHWFTERFHALLNWRAFSGGILWVLGGALAAGVAVYLWRRWRKGRFQRMGHSPNLPHRPVRLPAHVPFLDDLLRLLDPAATRRADLTPLEFVEPRLMRLAPAAAEKARWLVVTAYAVHFGGLRLDDGLKHDIALALRSVKAEVHSRP